MQPPDIDDEGYLVDPLTWTEDIANKFASQENIQTYDRSLGCDSLHAKVVRRKPGRAGCPSCNEASGRAIGA